MDPAKPEWITPGTIAYIIRRPTHVDPTATRVTIKTVAQKSFTTYDERSGGTQRWNFTTQREGDTFHRSLGTWNGYETLVPAYHSDVELVARTTRARTAMTRAAQAFTAWQANPGDQTLIEHLQLAIDTAQGATRHLARLNRHLADLKGQ